MLDFERTKRQIDECMDEAIVVMRELFRDGSPETRLQLAMRIMKMRGKAAAKALIGEDDPEEVVMAKELAAWILLAIRTDPEAYQQLKEWHATAKRQPKMGPKKLPGRS